MTRADSPASPFTPPRTAEVWGLPLAFLTLEETLDAVDALIAAGRPSYFITANLFYAMLTDQHPDMDAINRGAAFVLADGMPLVWASRYKGGPLPERVAGSDLIFRLSERAAGRGHRLFLLGGAPGIGEVAARVLRERYPGIEIVGVEAPEIGKSAEDEAALIERIRAARPDILFVALGQPKGERWIVANREALGVPVCVQVGASIDFVAGKVRRAPKWMQKTGLEWVYRMAQEPKRLGPRYARTIVFLGRMLGRDAIGRGR